MIKVKKILGLTLAIVLAVVANPVSVSAKESVQNMVIIGEHGDEHTFKSYEGENNFETSKMARSGGIVAASLVVTPRSNEIYIAMSTTTSFIASKVGVKNVYVQEKVWYGWKTIAQAADYDTNSNVFGGSCKCTNATKGKTYRVLCTHYAIESNGTEHTVANQSEEFVYN